MTDSAPSTSLRTLGGTALRVSPISLGTSSLGNPAAGSGADPVELAAMLLTGPFTVIDTSNNYAQGRSETALGQAIAAHGLPADREIVTKVDADPDTGRFDRDRVWRSFEESTGRLGLDRLPLLHLHDPYTITVEEAFGPGGAVRGLTELRDQGLVDAIGIAAGEVTMMTRYVAAGVFDVLLTHNRYTLVDRRAEALIEQATELGMGVFNAAPFGGGLLAGRGDRYAYRTSPPELLAWVDRVRRLCEEWGLTLPAVALWFSLRNPLVHSTIVGVNRPERLGQLQILYATTVQEEFWAALDALGTPVSTLDD
ncbi:aldo/keto reductase [Nonomuraea jiangxiensis]|uniref:D-threo-aldose 1-dehydrogenase n=1 Tax=Nonomuraea jiangxiensis TaxID=633440 RepID=A0A1G8A1J8_9ACTN|nr:aldo/keto reductase [Nonomuraea jiangxiensis]SDH14741.1 D-threo-aldose 1-dehydrogenase [Nonomuraea jiangxiensis]